MNRLASYVICAIFALVLGFSRSASGDQLDNKVSTASVTIPESFREQYPYYVAGKDLEGRTVFVVELLKWDLRKAAETGKSEELVAHVEKAMEIVRKFALVNITVDASSDSTDSTTLSPETIAEEKGVGWILDMDQFALRQLSSLTTVQLVVRIARILHENYRNFAYVYLINTNFAGQTLLNLIRPVLGESFSRIEVSGPNKALWLPKVLSRIAKDQLPEKYGGVKDFKMQEFFG